MVSLTAVEALLLEAGDVRRKRFPTRNDIPKIAACAPYRDYMLHEVQRVAPPAGVEINDTYRKLLCARCRRKLRGGVRRTGRGTDADVQMKSLMP